ncbi:MAG TPA: ABC transporter ATP-binding protein [Clostridia bacterium]|nr:ABC transporter ATP-binding protein [Clostridia bacterium]
MSSAKVAPAVHTHSLSRQFGDLTAVKALDLHIERGTMCALVGPDGSGKTTTIRMLCGIIPPSGGRVEVLGLDVQRNRRELKHRIGYLSQGFSLYEDLSVDENIEFFAEIHRVGDFKSRREELLEFTRLTPFRARLAGRLSGGMKKKLALACTLVHHPEIIFLDEPTTGVDPVSRRDFWLILSEVLKEGVSIVVSTPYLDEAERCTQVALLSAGKLLASDSPIHMHGRMEGHIVEFTVSDVRTSTAVLPQEAVSWCLEVQPFGDRIDVRCENVEACRRQVSSRLLQAGIEIFDAREVSASLENVFISMLRQEESTVKAI